MELNTNLDRLKKPLPTSLEAVMPYTADNEVYLSFSNTDLWEFKLVKFDTENGVISPIALPETSSMLASEI